MLLARTVLWRPAVSLPVQLSEKISHERAGKTDKAADGCRRFDAGAMHAALLSFRAHGRGECAPLPSKSMAPHQFGKPRTFDLSASQAGKTVNSSAITTPRGNDGAQRHLEAEVAHAIHPHQHHRVRAHSAQGGPSPQAKPAKTAGKSCASGRCTADPWCDRCSGPAVRFA